MSGEPDALAVVNQLRDLASDPLNRRAIVQDQGCLPGLILFLDHPNPQVVYSALLALRYLAECRANREKMRSELGMMLSLQNVIQKTTTGGTQCLNTEVYDLLQSIQTNRQMVDCYEGMNSRRRKAQSSLELQYKRAKTSANLLLPFQDAPVDVEQNTDLPDYLPEDESPMKEQDKAVSRVGAHQDGGSNWLSTAANFLSRSFYW
ncbi:hypothetical protein GDO81_011396 [Engystomops pustulosus]|uniref:Armadillo repeat-containing protein 1 n=1 Tax=Engystomops pustulosus TaxID=76066 RepID=A0AAV7BDQ7_ENGPU|nr:hypothetical protein GDO81_011396 [Engystomops pustulosus]KAG8570747.1 hypothetical protein GDO81_011396 [Engystomops pustulosus]